MVVLPITAKKDFQSLTKTKIKYVANNLVIAASKTPSKYHQINQQQRAPSFCRIAYITTKKISKKAVQRNKVKRQLGSIFRQLASEKLTKNHHDYIIISRKNILESSFAKIKSDVEFCVKGINKLIARNDNKTS